MSFCVPSKDRNKNLDEDSRIDRPGDSADDHRAGVQWSCAHSYHNSCADKRRHPYANKRRHPYADFNPLVNSGPRTNPSCGVS